MIDHVSRLCSGRFFDKFALDIINLCLGSLAGLRIIGGKSACLFVSTIRNLFSIGFDDNMGAVRFFRVHPDIIALGKFECQVIVLKVIFSNINIKTIGGTVVVRLALLTGILPASLGMGFGVAAFRQFPADFIQIRVALSQIDGNKDRFQMLNFLLGRDSQLVKRFAGTL